MGAQVDDGDGAANKLEFKPEEVEVLKVTENRWSTGVAESCVELIKNPLGQIDRRGIFSHVELKGMADGVRRRGIARDVFTKDDTEGFQVWWIVFGEQQHGSYK